MLLFCRTLETPHGFFPSRSLIPDGEGTECQFEEVQHKPCDPGPCPPLCLHDNRELSVGDTWLQGECEQWWGRCLE